MEKMQTHKKYQELMPNNYKAKTKEHNRTLIGQHYGIKNMKQFLNGQLEFTLKDLENTRFAEFVEFQRYHGIILLDVDTK
jgi:hypothetical protein